MQISGINTLTLLDFPKKTAAVVFTPGCNFRCGFCHNADYVLPEKLAEILPNLVPEKAFLNFLQTRKGLLDGIVISGGEPTLQADLIDFIRKVKSEGFLVKLDTNGTNPEILKKLLQENLLDYIAMDVKTVLAKYEDLVAMPVDTESITQSRDLIMQSGYEYEFRATVLPQHHTAEVLAGIQEFVQGAQTFAIQNFVNKSVLDPVYASYNGFTETELEKIAADFRKVVDKVLIRQ